MEGIGWAFYGDYQEVSKAIENLMHDSDRGAVIVAASIVEARLLAAIKHKLAPDPDVANNLFQPEGALGAFKPRIWLAFLLGLISAEAMKEMVAMAEIRNRFAHRLGAVDFSERKIAALSKELKMVDRMVGEISGEEVRALMERQERDQEEFLRERWADYEKAMRGELATPMHRFTGATEALKSPRLRFIMTAQVMSFSLGNLDNPFTRYPLI